jgi:protease IV
MTFIGKIWRILIGIKDGLVLLAMLLFFGLLYAALSSTPNNATVHTGALYIDLSGTIVEQPQQASPEELLLDGGQSNEHRLRDVVHVLETAAEDPRIKVVALDLDGFWGGGQVALQRVGDALDKVRKSGKPVIAFASGYMDDSYLLASHASEIWLDPMGIAIIAGPGGNQPYFKGLVDKLGVTVNVYRVGKYKSFVEPFIRTDQSPEARAANQALADAIFADWMANAKSARPKAKLDAYIAASANMDGPMSDKARQFGIVDQVADKLAWAKRIAKIAGTEDDQPADSFKQTDFADYLTANPLPSDGKIGIITVAGEIVDGEAPAGSAGGDTIARIILDALAKKELKALVLRIDSPGGSALASEKIRQALLQAKAQGIPVIASMGNVAASGGYWVAMAGDKVFAEPGTITGSIGVFGVLPTFEKSLAKLGVTADGVGTTPLSGQPDLLRGTNAATNQLFQAGVEDVYRRFTGLVAAQRKLPLTKVMEIAEGRVWDGGSARQLGLIDAFGSLEDAISEAAKRAKLSGHDARPVYLDRMPNWFELYAEGLMGSEAHAPIDPYGHLMLRQQAGLIAGVQDGLTILNGPAIQVRCLGCPSAPKIVRKKDTLTALILAKAGR